MEACLICHAPLHYFHEKQELRCEICGEHFFENVSCENGHYICNSCHQKDAMAAVREICLSSESKNPAHILTRLMRDERVHMHGPEHHFLDGCALLTAYKNAGGMIDGQPIDDLSSLLDEMIDRARDVPGGICGFWGSCGAAIASGIFLSIVTSSDPLQSGESWAQPNRMTAKSLAAIADIGGPRCCKRNGFIALRETVQYANDLFHIEMEWEDPVCSFFPRNDDCLATKCPFFPK